ncbi:MAG: hypothetical protein J0M00_13235 [Burkholderiales bacterium]|nr:hypothetical protein [Burkholderiales bacterium]
MAGSETEAQPMLNSVRTAPANVVFLLRVCSNWFALRRDGEFIRWRLLHQPRQDHRGDTHSVQPVEPRHAD